MVLIAPPGLVAAPPRAALPYGLFSVVTFRAGDRWESGAQWESITCEPAGTVGGPDCSATTGALGKNPPKGNPITGTANPFTVFGVFRCSPVGYSPADAQAKAREHLLNREEAAVERLLWTGAEGNTPALVASGSQVGGAALSPAAALGAVEEGIATGYGSLGVIHMTRAIATEMIAADLLVVSGQRLRTVLGTPVIAGAGYPGTGPASASAGDRSKTRWVFGSPALFGYRSEIHESTSQPGDLFDRDQNNLAGVAERTYLIGYDPCPVVAALVL